MAYNDLRDFIRKLQKEHELKRITIEVDPVLEIAEFADRSVKSGGPALLFERPKGCKIPVLINSFASAQARPMPRLAPVMKAMRFCMNVFFSAMMARRHRLKADAGPKGCMPPPRGER